MKINLLLSIVKLLLNKLFEMIAERIFLSSGVFLASPPFIRCQ